MSVQGTVSILTYHSVAVETTNTFATLTVDPSLFRDHLDALCEQGVDLIPFGQVPYALAAGRTAVAITIDDGLGDIAAHACPAMAERGIPATLFVPSLFIGERARWLPGPDGRRPILSRAEIADLHSQGFEIGSHGRRHLAADVNNPGVILRDALASRLELEECTGDWVRSFAYPFGYHSAAARAAIRQAGYWQACAVGDLHARTGDDQWALPRLQVRNDTTAEALVAMVTRPAGAPARKWAQAKQRIWGLGRRWAQVGPVEAGRLTGARQ